MHPGCDVNPAQVPVQIRIEKDDDHEAIEAVNAAAFETPAEAVLVAALRTQARPLVSLVAEQRGVIIGHIMFSPVVLSEHPELDIMGLAPMAVVPEQQRRGIGSSLVGAGLDACRRIGAGAVVVLGHPAYYPRFGFTPAARFQIGSEYDVPSEAFMTLELTPGYLHGASGKVRYHVAFSDI